MIEEGKDPSKEFFDRPELDDHLQFYWTAFNDLTTDRQVGMGLGPIPYSSIRNYAVDYNIRGRDEFDYFLRLMMVMDTKYLQASSIKKDPEMVPVSDVGEQHLLFARLAARSKSVKRRK